MKRTKSVDDYINNSELWNEELRLLRAIMRETRLLEDLKWGAPCYTYKGKNVVGIGGFKSYFGLWFHQGALLKDNDNVLINAQAGRTKALRQWRMVSAADIRPARIRRYVAEAVELIDQGKEIKADRGKDVEIPDELQRVLRRDKNAKSAFSALRKGQQREYADYVADAKRDDTKQRRIEKILPMILKRVGLNDKYR